MATEDPVSGVIGTEIRRSPVKSVEWYTPAWIFDALGISFDLDPSSPHDFETAVPATTKYTVYDDGLLKPWFGRVWMNPPYGKSTPKWIRRMVKHGNGIALLFSRTDARWCQEAMRAATGILFLSGRVAFIPGKENLHKRSRCGAGTVMFAYGDECAVALKKLQHHGFYIGRQSA
jgi:hypothetical protein